MMLSSYLGDDTMDWMKLWRFGAASSQSAIKLQLKWSIDRGSDIKYRTL